MRKIINCCKYWGQLLLLPLYWLSFLFPRDKHIWLFGSTFGRRFADNPRYFYLYISQHRQELGIRPIWISHNREIVSFLTANGYEAFYYHSLKGIWYALRGKIYLFDNYSKDINFWQSGGAIKINMWHGIPLKKIQADNVFDKIRHPENTWERFKAFPRRLSDEKPSHYVLTTSEFMAPIFSSAFQTKKILVAGYPRNDRLITPEIQNLLSGLETENKSRITQFLSKSDKRKMIYYMPTFRDSETRFFEVMQLDRFREFLAENDMLFCVKLHPKSKLRKQFDRLSDKNILVINADTDPYVFLELADVLVTDYSSIYFDFLLTDKPLIFFSYDLTAYLQDSREMYFDYEAFTPGKKAETMEELETALLQACQTSQEYFKQYEKQRKLVTDKVFHSKTRLSSPALTKEIMQITGGFS